MFIYGDVYGIYARPRYGKMIEVHNDLGIRGLRVELYETLDLFVDVLSVFVYDRYG